MAISFFSFNIVYFLFIFDYQSGQVSGEGTKGGQGEHQRHFLTTTHLTMGSGVDLNKLLGNQLLKRYLKNEGKSQYVTQEDMNLELGKSNYLINSNVRGLICN